MYLLYNYGTVVHSPPAQKYTELGPTIQGVSTNQDLFVYYISQKFQMSSLKTS